jgi:hypothetical protein
MSDIPIPLDEEIHRSTEGAVLERYTRLEISASQAMAALEFQCLEELMAAEIKAGFQLPRVDTKSALKMARAAVRQLRLPSQAQLRCARSHDLCPVDRTRKRAFQRVG